MITLHQDQIAAAASRLYQAEANRTQTGQISLDHPEMTIDDGYAIQQHWMARKVAEGRRVIGHKIGLTSRAMQQSSQITEPDYGALLDDMWFAEGDALPASRFIVPMVEVELAFVLNRRLEGDRVTLTEVLNATDYVIPAAEIIDARCQRIDPVSKRPRKVMDTIADNAASAGIVMGGRAIRPLDQDLRWTSALLYRNGVIEETGVAAGVLNHPAHGIVWLARRLAAKGVALEPGAIVLSGSFTRPVPARGGDVFHLDYGALGAFAFSFAPETQP